MKTHLATRSTIEIQSAVERVGKISCSVIRLKRISCSTYQMLCNDLSLSISSVNVATSFSFLQSKLCHMACAKSSHSKEQTRPRTCLSSLLKEVVILREPLTVYSKTVRPQDSLKGHLIPILQNHSLPIIFRRSPARYVSSQALENLSRIAKATILFVQIKSAAQSLPRTIKIARAVPAHNSYKFLKVELSLALRSLQSSLCLADRDPEMDSLFLRMTHCPG